MQWFAHNFHWAHSLIVVNEYYASGFLLITLASLNFKQKLFWILLMLMRLLGKLRNKGIIYWLPFMNKVYNIMAIQWITSWGQVSCGLISQSVSLHIITWAIFQSCPTLHIQYPNYCFILCRPPSRYKVIFVDSSCSGNGVFCSSNEENHGIWFHHVHICWLILNQLCLFQKSVILLVTLNCFALQSIIFIVLMSFVCLRQTKPCTL